MELRERFVRAKAWQVMAMAMAGPAVVTITGIISAPDHSGPARTLMIIGLSVGYFAAVMSAWVWGAGEVAAEALGVSKWAKGLGVSLISMTQLTILLLVLNPILGSDNSVLRSAFSEAGPYLFLLGASAYFGLNIYAAYFIFRMNELFKISRNSLFSTFFLVWFSFFGVWIIQPNINDIFNSSSDGLA